MKEEDSKEVQESEQKMQPKKKRSISLTQYIISLIIIAIVASGATVAVFGIYSRKEATQLRGSSIQSIDYLNQVIKMAYFDKVDDQKLIDGALKGMVEALDDPYSSYFSKSEAKDFDDSISGSFEGIGAVMTMQDGVPTIAEPPIKGSPAEKAQLRANDKILKINDKKVSDKSLNDVVKEVRGKKGSTVKLEVARDKEVFNVEIKRDKIPVESVKSNIDKNHKNIGYIDIKSFNDTTSDEFNKAIESLEKEGAKGLIIDVRGNPGGILPQVEEITSRFLRNGETIVQFEDRNKKESKDTASEQLDEGKKINLPTVLLVDQDSASASEIMAAALKDSGRFDVVGTKTFGKGTVQSLIPLGDQGEAKLTISKWLTPKGQWIHKKGVEPTVDVEYPEYLKNRMIDTSKTYREGMISDDVKIINSDLQALGYQVDGKSDTYTNTTKTAVSEFQEKEDLTVTGEVDKDTAVKIVESVINYWKANDTQYQKAMDLVLEKVK